jgi:hypothetical protein
MEFYVLWLVVWLPNAGNYLRNVKKPGRRLGRLIN